jgi:hypothetical protein
MWTDHAEALTDFAWKHMVNRTDVCGYYSQGQALTAQDGEGLTRENLLMHFRGETTIGLHTTSAANTCKWIAYDIDDGTPERNWVTVCRILLAAKERDLFGVVEDSNGAGRFHIWFLFSSPISSAEAHALAHEILAEAEVVCEVFPKQAALDEGQVGNWLRLPGRHHKLRHVSRFHDGQDWGGPEIFLRAVLNGEETTEEEAAPMPPPKPAPLPAPKPAPKPAPLPAPPLNLPDFEDVVSALEAIPNVETTYKTAGYDSWRKLWITILGALALYNTPEARAAAYAWSLKHPNGQDEKTFDHQWNSLLKRKPGKAVTGKTIIQIASKHFGWTPQNEIQIVKPSPSPITPSIATTPEELKEIQRAAVEKMNSRFAVVRLESKTFVIEEKSPNVIYWDVKHLGVFLANQYIQTGVEPQKGGRPEHKPLLQFWLSSPERRTYHGVDLCPPPRVCPADYYDLWRGWAVEPDPSGSCQRFLDHLLNVVCCGVQEYYDFLMAWLADAIQFPGRKPTVAVVMRGGQGAGKNATIEYLARIYGPHVVTVTNPAHVTGHFNAHIERALLLHADEAFNVNCRTAASTLKALITGEHIMIEHKGINVRQALNMTRLVMSSNADWVVPAEKDDRRFFVLDVSTAHAKDFPYFNALVKERDKEGGPAALLHHLQNLDYSHINLRAAPATAALAAQKFQSADSPIQWWASCLQDGYISGDGWPPWVESGDFYNTYVSAMQADRRALRTKIGFFMLINSVCPNIRKQRSTLDGGRRVNGYSIPPLSACRASYEEAVGPIRWNDAAPEEPEDEDSRVIESLM